MPTLSWPGRDQDRGPLERIVEPCWYVGLMEVLQRPPGPLLPMARAYEIDDIADGAYRVMFDLGEDWDRQAEQFRHAKPAQRFDDPFDFKTTETSRGWRYTTYEITLHTVPLARPEPARCPTQSFSGTDSALLVLWWRAGAGAQRISACGPGSPGSRGRRQARRLQCPRWGCHQATPAIDPACQRELAAATGRVTSLFVEARPLQELWLAG